MEIFLGRKLSARGGGPTSRLQILVAPCASQRATGRNGVRRRCRAEDDRQLRQPIKRGAGSPRAHRRMSALSTG
jgi:hypothetical protein